MLFCDEKGFVITNATVINGETLEIIIKDDVAEILKRELEKYSKFYNCEIGIKEKLFQEFMMALVLQKPLLCQKLPIILIIGIFLNS